MLNEALFSKLEKQIPALTIYISKKFDDEKPSFWLLVTPTSTCLLNDYLLEETIRTGEERPNFRSYEERHFL